MRTFLVCYDELPKMFRLIAVLIFFVSSHGRCDPVSLRQSCFNSLQHYKSYFKVEALNEICDHVEKKENCNTYKRETGKGKNKLRSVLALITVF